MKKDKRSKKKGRGTPLGSLILCMAIGAVCGIVMVGTLDGTFAWAGSLGGLAIELLLFLVAFYLQTIIHEGGHLVAGLMTGYGFGSFRIGSLMFVKESGKIKVKKHSVVGTGGQCLMIPPKMVDGKFPVIFYNLGGVLMNLIFTAIPVILAILFVNKPIIYAFCVLMALAGFISAATNGIPLRLGIVNNDGSNARELYKNEEAMRVFHNQFMTMAALSDGKPLSEMPEEWFFMPSEAGFKNSITVSGAVFRENWLMDCGKYDEALELIDLLLTSESALIGLHKCLLTCDKILLLLLRGETEKIGSLASSGEMQAFFKQMKGNISVVRVQYAMAKLLDGDEKRAAELLELFEKCAKTHPYPVKIIGERRILAQIDAVSEEK